MLTKAPTQQRGWIVIDLRTGNMDGYYQPPADAMKYMEHVRSGWAKRLGHEDLIVAETHGPEFVPIPDATCLTRLVDQRP